MSKNHTSDISDDLDAQLDAFIASKKTQPIVQNASAEIDLFGSNAQKKKSKLHLFLIRTFPSLLTKLT